MDQRAAAAKAQFQSARNDLRHSMAIQSEVVSNITKDAELPNALSQRSQGAEGALQAEQATNQLLALSAKQQMQLQDLLSVQFRSESMERARQIQAEDEARSATRRFLGTGKAYSSTHE
jgi:P-type conjugative transfer protein TrbJ